MKFDEVARLIGSELPPSAYKHRPWWANEATGHTHAKAWLAAGYEATQVDMEGRKLIFKRIAVSGTSPRTPHGMSEEPREFCTVDARLPGRHPAIGALKGTFTIAPGWDLTKPALDSEELAEWEASLDRKADLYEQGLKGKK